MTKVRLKLKLVGSNAQSLRVAVGCRSFTISITDNHVGNDINHSTMMIRTARILMLTSFILNWKRESTWHPRRIQIFDPLQGGLLQARLPLLQSPLREEAEPCLEDLEVSIKFKHQVIFHSVLVDLVPSGMKDVDSPWFPKNMIYKWWVFDIELLVSSRLRL